MKCAYVTILSSENFKPGVKALFKGIRKFSDKDFVVFTGNQISEKTCAELKKLGMHIIKEEEPGFDEGVIGEKQAKDRWNKTLFKFVIFKDYGYDKLVYLDSDLLIRGSLDELFEKPNWSAVPDKAFYPECSRGGLNAGVMVLEPSKETYEELIKRVEVVSKKQEIFGDQDVINEYLSDWEEKDNLHLSEEYNKCFYSVRGCKEPKVVHFIFEDKPWMWNKAETILKRFKWYIAGKRERNRFLSEYFKLFRE